MKIMRESKIIENIFITTNWAEGLLVNLNNVVLIKKEESSVGEWLHVFSSNGETTTVYNADREIWSALISLMEDSDE